VEALIRWDHPVRGLIPPGHFVGFAEQTGLIEPIGEWVLREACRQFREWQLTAGLAVPVAVNLSAHQFNNKNLTTMVRDILLESGLEAQYLELEVTESTIMHDAEAVVMTLHQLKKMGVRIAIDDFGTGYSSLNYLKRFPVDRLKIDQSFVRDICHSPQDKAICGAIVGIAKNLQLSTVVEGVETQEQLQALRTLECQIMQGYLYSPPLSTENFIKYHADCSARGSYESVCTNG
jgi:EAL domain-containing protein (putative c-di-GMP-specific phosphodiesterase class I)